MPSSTLFSTPLPVRWRPDDVSSCVSLAAFGLKERRERAGRNPKTGESVAVEAKRVLFFKMGKELRERVDK
jgi:nucleoid DNA-binding protein